MKNKYLPGGPGELRFPNTGQPTDELSTQKATECCNTPNRLLKTGNLGAHDQLVARSRLQDLKNALQGKP
jgi:hypothetical protein